MFSALRLMVDEGIGGDRSTGKGIYDSITVAPFDQQLAMPCYFSLSRTIPAEEEVQQMLYYSFVKDDGFIYLNGPCSTKKSTLHFLEEGSVFLKDIQGKVIISEHLKSRNNTGENIQVRRYGKAFLLPG